jgi:hypothetical protein
MGIFFGINNIINCIVDYEDAAYRQHHVDIAYGYLQG